MPLEARRWLLVGRWLLLVEAVFGTAVLIFWRGSHGIAVPALLAVCAYSVASLFVFSRKPVERAPLRTLLFLDLVSIGVAASVTGGSRSLPVAQFFIVIFVAALVRGLWGGIIAGGVAAGISSLLALATPDGWHSSLRPLTPSLLIAGGAMGYLAHGMQTWARRFGDSLLREKQQEFEEMLAERERAVDAKIARKEMDLARAMQLAALPTAVPNVPGLDIAARSELAQEVGGDFYMFLRDGDRTDLVLGDVSGKGIQAAFTATSVAYLLPWLKPLQDPLAALSNLNADLIEHLPESSFVTLVMAEVDAVSGTLQIWCAGHPPALLWRASTAQVEDGTGTGPLLGIVPRWAGVPQRCPFDAGDVLLLYSDGLTEVRNGDSVMFDVRVRAVLAETAGEPAEVILEAMFREVLAWGTPLDDLTVLVCRRTGDALGQAPTSPA